MKLLLLIVLICVCLNYVRSEPLQLRGELQRRWRRDILSPEEQDHLRQMQQVQQQQQEEQARRLEAQKIQNEAQQQILATINGWKKSVIRH